MGDKWNKGDEWEEEAAEPLDRKLVVLIVLGLAVLAAIICTGLWYFTHADKTGGEGQDLLAQATENPEPPVKSTLPPATEPAGGAGQESEPNAAFGTSSATPSGADSGTGPATPSGADSGTGPATPSGADSGTGPVTPSGADSDIEPAPTPGVDSGTASAQTPKPAPEATPGAASTQPPESASQAASSGSVQGVGGQETTSGKVPMEFMAVKESVMPKDILNLRSAPTTTDEGNIVTQIQNGEVIVRTGINENTGWSEVEYQGQVLYAVSQYLTANLNYQPPAQPSDPNRVSTIGGRIIVFTSCDDWISPKEYVNLRTEPSTSEGDDTVSCQLNYGEKVHRTGYSADAGWSRVEHNGQVLYVVTSFMLEDAAE